MSQTTSQDPFGRSRAEISLEVSFAILICLTSILGNVLVLYVINKYSEMQTITNIFIHNLALTDIFMATINMPVWITNLYTGKWNLSHKWCEVSASAQVTMCLASMFNMGLIALNRYIRVVKPASYNKFFPRKRVAWLYCGVVWLVSVLFATLPLYGWGKIGYDSDTFLCHFIFRGRPHSSVIVIVGILNVTTCTMIYSYWKIYKKVKESTEIVNVNMAQNGVGAPRFHRTDINVLKSCFTVVCFFFVTWGPPAIAVNLTTVGDDVPHTGYKVASYFFFCSSLVNPIIYGMMNPQFKEAFKKVFCCGRYGNDNTDQSHARVVTEIIHPRSNETR